MENNHKPLLTKLADIFPENLPDGTDSVALKDIWNYYDPIHVARTECNENEGGSPDSYGCQELVDIPELHNVLTEQEFLDLEALVEQTEQMKFVLDAGLQNLTHKKRFVHFLCIQPHVDSYK